MHLGHYLEIIKVTKVRDTRDVGIHYVQMTPKIIARALRLIEDRIGMKAKMGMKNASVRGWDKLVYDHAQECRKKVVPITFLPCHHCRKPIPEYTICISKRKGGHMRGYYHPECARTIHIINS